jgi:hypothetical protein
MLHRVLGIALKFINAAVAENHQGGISIESNFFVVYSYNRENIIGIDPFT